MKKNLLLLFTAFALLQFSCSKDDDAIDYKPDQVFQESQFLGYWRRTQVKMEGVDGWYEVPISSCSFFEFKEGNILNDYNTCEYPKIPEVSHWDFDGKNILNYTLKDGTGYQLKLISIVDRELIAEVNVTLKNGEKESGVWKYHKMIASLDDYYNNFTGGFKVKDTTNFQLVTIGYNYITATKDNKLWLGFFDQQSHEQLSEKKDKEDFSFTKTVYKGYGEYQTYTIVGVSLEEVVNDDLIKLNYRMESKTDEHLDRILWFTNSGKKIDLPSSDYNVIPWYNNSYVIYYAQNMACLTEQGDTIFSSKTFNYYDFKKNNTFPINYNYYIGTRILSNKIIAFYMDRFVDDGNTAWNKGYVAEVEAEETDFKYTINPVSKNASTWTFQVDITEYSGKKHSHTVEIDISEIKE